MRRSPFFLAGTVALALAVPARAQEAPARSLRLTFDESGLVTLSASNVSVREILAEWARQCGCYVVNWDKLGGGPLTVPLLFERQPQHQVLEAILRSAAGYVLTPKRAASRSVSNYETIYIVPTSTAVAGSYVAPPPIVPTFMPMPTPGSPEDEIPGLPTSPPPGGGRPEGPGQPNRPGLPTAAPPGTAPGAMPPRPVGAPSVFVPIVPVTSTPSNSPGQAGTPPPGSVPPGTRTAPPPMPVPIVPAPAR